MLDLLARNAFLSHPYINAVIGGTVTPGGDVVNILANDYFDPDFVETVRVHLEENEVPGVSRVSADDVQTIVCTTTPRVIKDIRMNLDTGKWLELQEYAGGAKKFNGEVGAWGGVRFVKTNRLHLRNYGDITTQTTLNGATVAGQGSAVTVDTVYNPGQSNSTRYVAVTSSAGFAVGQFVTISDVSLNGGAGNPPIESDGTQETRRIVALNSGGANRLSFDRPLMKPHDNGALVTNGLNIHASIFHGGPGVAYGVGEAPHVITPPKFDDLMMINRYGWRGFLKMQMIRPEFFEVILSAGSTD